MITFIQRIDDLANFLDGKDHRRDVANKVISKLKQSLEDANKNEYPKAELYDLIYSKNNCLDTQGADKLPEEMLEEIRNLQDEIVDAYGVQD